MENFWIWFSLIIIASAMAVVFFSYYHSSEVLYPVKRKTPVSFFPDQLKLPYEDLLIRCRDGIFLRGWFVPAEQPSEKTIVLMHGWGKNKGDLLAHTAFLRNSGFNLVYFDFRGSGDSDGAMTTVGYLEIRDLEAVLEFLELNKPEETASLGFYGISMGASVGIFETAKNKHIKCLVAEAAFDSYEKVVGRWAWNSMKIPYQPFIALSLYFARLRLGVDPEPYSPIHNITSVAPRPILFIYGSHDNLVPQKDAQILFAAASEPKELWIVPGASHGKCAETGGEEYRKRINDFFVKNL